jgi:hypothetical protein
MLTAGISSERIPFKIVLSCGTERTLNHGFAFPLETKKILYVGFNVNNKSKATVHAIGIDPRVARAIEM